MYTKKQPIFYEDEQDLNENNLGSTIRLADSFPYIQLNEQRSMNSPKIANSKKKLKKKDQNYSYTPEKEELEEEDEDNCSSKSGNFRKTKKVEKKKRKNKNQNYSKWKEEEKRTFWLGHMEIMETHPLNQYSWKYWKVDGCFKKMQPKFAKFEQPKNHRQIKSYDQRMKHYFLKKNKDIPEAIIESLEKQYQHLSSEEQQAFDNFKNNYEKKNEQIDFENVAVESEADMDEEIDQKNKLNISTIQKLSFKLQKLSLTVEKEGNQIKILRSRILKNKNQ